MCVCVCVKGVGHRRLLAWRTLHGHLAANSRQAIHNAHTHTHTHTHRYLTPPKALTKLVEKTEDSKPSSKPKGFKIEKQEKCNLPLLYVCV